MLPEETARSVFAKANALSAADARRVWDELSLARERLAPLTDEQSALQERYHAAKRERNLPDYPNTWSTGWPACKPNRNASGPMCWSTKYRTFRRCRLPLCGR